MQQDGNINIAMQRLEVHLRNLEMIFAGLPANELLQRPAPGKWSKAEILGHLIDSALNNLKRFTEIQFLPQPYTNVPYVQDALVAVNNYQELPLLHLLNLWKSLNQQILYVVANIPPGKLNYEVRTNEKDIKTLGWLITDYVAHMEHHLQQIESGRRS